MTAEEFWKEKEKDKIGIWGLDDVKAYRTFILEEAFELMEEYASLKVAEAMAKMSGEDRYTEKDVDMAYLIGAFNSAKLDGLADELKRLRELKKQPHEIVDEIRNHMKGGE